MDNTIFIFRPLECCLVELQGSSLLTFWGKNRKKFAKRKSATSLLKVSWKATDNVVYSKVLFYFLTLIIKSVINVFTFSEASRNAETTFRDKSGRIRDLKSERVELSKKAGEKAEKDEKYAQWGKGWGPFNGVQMQLLYYFQSVTCH